MKVVSGNVKKDHAKKLLGYDVASQDGPSILNYSITTSYTMPTTTVCTTSVTTTVMHANEGSAMMAAQNTMTTTRTTTVSDPDMEFTDGKRKNLSGNQLATSPKRRILETATSTKGAAENDKCGELSSDDIIKICLLIYRV